jgi:hypothetical protein
VIHALDEAKESLLELRTVLAEVMYPSGESGQVASSKPLAMPPTGFSYRSKVVSKLLPFRFR